METIKFNSEGNSVTLLQQLLAENGFYTSSPTGQFDTRTRDAVMAFQRQHGLDADGIVGYRSWEALFFVSRGDEIKLTENDFELTARLLDVEPAALKAVKSVESGKYGGFFKPGKPVILFEGHVFWKQLKQRGINPELHVSGNENILYPQWSKDHYAGGLKEYERLEKARAIHREAADASASWGMFQIMGFNHVLCGEKSVAGFVEMMHKSELHQLLLSARFIKSAGMLPALQQKNWMEFARRYNGPKYAENKYDRLLAAAYSSFAK